MNKFYFKQQLIIGLLVSPLSLLGSQNNDNNNDKLVKEINIHLKGIHYKSNHIHFNLQQIENIYFNKMTVPLTTPAPKTIEIQQYLIDKRNEVKKNVNDIHTFMNNCNQKKIMTITSNNNEATKIALITFDVPFKNSDQKEYNTNINNILQTAKNHKQNLHAIQEDSNKKLDALTAEYNQIKLDQKNATQQITKLPVTIITDNECQVSTIKNPNNIINQFNKNTQTNPKSGSDDSNNATQSNNTDSDSDDSKSEVEHYQSDSNEESQQSNNQINDNQHKSKNINPNSNQSKANLLFSLFKNIITNPKSWFIVGFGTLVYLMRLLSTDQFLYFQKIFYR